MLDGMVAMRRLISSSVVAPAYAEYDMYKQWFLEMMVRRITAAGAMA